MTWGTHCPQCGLTDCRWTRGDTCEGLGMAGRGANRSRQEPDGSEGAGLCPARLTIAHDLVKRATEIISRGCGCDHSCERDGTGECGCEEDAIAVIRLAQSAT